MSYILGIKYWDTRNVTNMSFMFYKCLCFQIIPYISKWNTKLVSKIGHMFYKCGENLEKEDDDGDDDVMKIEMKVS